MGAAGRSLTRAPIATALLAVAIGGCGGQRGEDLPAEVAPPPTLPELEGAPRPEPLYGEDGSLLESDRSVAGLPLPRGLQVVVDQDRQHVYVTEVPLALVQQYFGVRLITGAVDARPGGGASYRGALPRDARGSTVRLDVTIEPSSAAATRVEIVEVEPPPVTPPTEAETIERVREQLKRAD